MLDMKVFLCVSLKQLELHLLLLALHQLCLINLVFHLKKPPRVWWLYFIRYNVVDLTDVALTDNN
ncbi:MAG: hypothetical protein H6Q73_1325 [Firmicutes bacterium]|nr:hypothetical protein [Bacillota bacterium]